VREDQILGASGRPERVGLNKAEESDGTRQTGGLKEAARDGVTAKLRETEDFERVHIFCRVSGLRGNGPATGFTSRLDNSPSPEENHIL
jgi:hypothetical protein